MKEDLSIGDAFEEFANKALYGSLSFGTIEEYGLNLEQYLNKPYTFELPPSGEKLLPSDPGYNFYICRSNVSENIYNLVYSAAENKDLPLTRIDRERLSFIKNDIKKIISNTNNRTPEEMRVIKNLTEEAYKIVSSKNNSKKMNATA